MPSDTIDNLAVQVSTNFNPHEEVQHLLNFEGTPEQFLEQWLRTVCKFASLGTGALLVQGGGESGTGVALRSVYPPFNKDDGSPRWLQQVAAQLTRMGWPTGQIVFDIPVIGGLYGQSQKILAFPVDIDGGKLLMVFLIGDAQDTDAIAAMVTPFTCLLHTFSASRMVIVQENALKRFRKLFELQSSLRHHPSFKLLAMAICNELAGFTGAERVSLGVMGSRFVKCQAMSHTEKLNRKMKVVRQIEHAMEESLDQQHIVIYPTTDNSQAVTRMAEELCRHQGSGLVISIPICVASEPKIVILMEFTDRIENIKDVLEITSAVGEIEGTRLYEFYLHSQWFGKRLVRELRKFAGMVVGSKHTLLKLGAIAAICVLFWAVFFKGDYEIEAPVVLEAVQQRVVAAPFECYLVESNVQPGDSVEAGKTLLGSLDDGELRQQLAAQEAKRQTFLKRAAMANREGKTADAQVELSQARQTEAEIDLIKYRLSKIKIIAPTSGYMVSEDMGKQLGRSFKTGDVMFEIAAVDSLRAVIRVAEQDVSQLAVGQSGEFAIIANPGQKLKFTIERIHPAANVVEQANVFEVWATIENKPDWLRPGLEGEAHIFVAKRRHIWIWTHRASEWVQMKFWQWF